MDDLVQDFFIRPEGNTFNLDVYESYTNLFTIKCHYYGKFNDGPKKEYIEGETCFVDLVNRDQFTDVVLNTVINSLGYEMEDEVLYWYKIPLKSLDVGLKPLVSESDYRRFLGYVKKHKVMDVYVEIVEKNEESESGSDSASESDNDFEDEEHVVQEVEVNMGYFNFQVEDASTGTDGNMIPVAPKVNLTEDNIEVLEFDSLESDLEDVPENDRRDVAKDLIRTHAVESRRNLHFLRNDPIRIRVVCNGVVPCKKLVTYKVPGPNVDNAVKGKIVNEDAEEDKITCPWLLYLSKGDKGKWDYVWELKRCNPDTTVKIDVYGEEDPESPTRLFRRIYVCLGALKRGFREGGRELLGLDGAFMRGQYPGQMLTAVGVDANNGIYPVAYGIVESENQYSWTWVYYQHLKSCFHMLSTGRAHCDLLINNICEVFNRQLLEARDSPIITALEHVREYLMKRIVVVQKIIEKCDGPLTPAVARVFDIIKEASSECIVDWNGADQYQVKGYLQEQYVVNLKSKELVLVGSIPEDWVHDSYKLATWKAVYSHKVNPVNMLNVDTHSRKLVK
ncbi:mutator type transposase [Tanacetum coccineum]